MRLVSYLGHRLKRLGLHIWQAKACPSGRLAGVGESLADPLGVWQAFCKYAEAALSSTLAAQTALPDTPAAPGQVRVAISRLKWLRCGK